jgi:UDP-GlcNAc:undecaprenyl-phosphate/decaprenyl-phosphate GlcNAc-1-phosphate transferase
MLALLPLNSTSFISSTLISVAATWGVWAASTRCNVATKPRGDRWHQQATPSTGGIAILTTCVIGYVLFCRGAEPAIALACLVISLVGLADDRVELTPRTKLLVQILTATTVVMSGHVLAVSPSWLLNAALTMLSIVGITNAFNLIDNMDGLCAGVTVIISVSGAFLTAHLRDSNEAVLFAVLAGSLGGFLVFNYHPARIFMGDCGSMLAGFSLACLTIGRGEQRDLAFAALYPALTFVYPIFDTVFVSILRKLSGRRVTVGGRDHTSHRLVSFGFKQRTAVLAFWSTTACA